MLELSSRKESVGRRRKNRKGVNEAEVTGDEDWGNESKEKEEKTE